MNDEILKQIAELVIQTAEAVAPLLAATEQHAGPMGGEYAVPTPKERATQLQSKANALRQVCGIDRPTLQE